MDEGSAYGWPVHDDGSREQRSGYLKYSRPLAPRLTLDLDASALSRVLETDFNDRFDGENIPFQYTRGTESTRNAGARLTWGDSRRNLVAGAEYGHVNAKSEQVVPAAFVWNMRRWDQGAVYANGTLSIGRVTILPGIRYDHTGLSRQYTSYTLGATWQATENTLLRGYAARGFGLPFPDMLASGLMKVHTLQAGFESAGIPYVWLKGTYFFNRLRDIESVGAATLTNQSRKGFELEARTTPLYGVSLTGGYTFTYVKDTDTGERLKTNSDQAVPPHVLKLGLLYDALDLGLRGALTGSYVAWNPAEDYPAVSHGTVWDLHLAWKVKPQAERSPELFCSGRNLFSNVQTTFNDLFANTSRWFEGGVRWNF
jgi:vitamin B12 transporter